MNRITELVQAWASRVREIAMHAFNPEGLVGYAIMTLWALLAGRLGGWVFVVVLVVIGLATHTMAVESGTNPMLWVCATLLLLYTIMAWVSFVEDPSPLVITFAGCSVLAHNQTIRLGNARRREAAVDESIFLAAAAGVAVVSIAALAGSVVAVSLFDRSASWSWLWMPAAAACLFLVGFVVALLPPWRSPMASRERWRPGERIPPQPLGGDDEYR